MVIGPGDQIGGRELMDDGRFNATFTTLTPANVVVVYAPVFRWAARRFAEVASAMSHPTALPVVRPVSFVN
jgi:hypothetical protein